jgi:hypothetical protein
MQIWGSGGSSRAACSLLSCMHLLACLPAMLLVQLYAPRCCCYLLLLLPAACCCCAPLLDTRPCHAQLLLDKRGSCSWEAL